MSLGGLSVIMPAFEPAAFLAAIEHYRVTLVTSVPTIYELTLRHPEMLVAHLGNYGELVLRVLADAAAENPAFTLNVQ